jgi:c(7)-type cytochrome triheme protein
MVALVILMIFATFGVLAAQKDGGIIVYPVSSANLGPVVFSHQSHEDGSGYTCKMCHAGESGNYGTFTMETIRKGQACGSCHDGRVKNPRNGQNIFPVHQCPSCHMPPGDTIIALNRMDPVIFSHRKHLGAQSQDKSIHANGISCRDCHPVPFERSLRRPLGMALPHEKDGCAVCHNGGKPKQEMPVAFPATTRCLTCHQPKEQVSAIKAVFGYTEACPREVALIAKQPEMEAATR